MVDRLEIPGSRVPAPPAQPSGHDIAGDQMTVSVYLKPKHHPAGSARPTDRTALKEARQSDHADDVAQIRAYADANGMKVSLYDPGRRLVQVTGTVAAFEAAFGTQLRAYEANGRSFRGREGALHMPPHLVDCVDAVLGMDTRPIATPKIVPHQSATPPTGFLPTEVVALYGLGDLAAAGQCIAIIELGGGYTAADNTAAFKAMGRPVPNIVAVAVDGGKNAPGDDSGADGEVALDIQVAGAAAPGAALAVYFAPNTSQGFVDAISQAMHDEANKPTTISISWGSPESGWSGQALSAMNAVLDDAPVLSVTVLAASGDALATDGVKDGKPHVDYPASNPNVLGCGGTRIEAANGVLQGEVVWKSNGGGTGGGISALFPRPSYQATAHVPKPKGKAGGRGVPDVSGNADPDSGYRIVIGGKTGLVGGTSAVAPLWAGIIAGLNAGRKAPIGLVQPLLYAHPDALRDVTSGNNKAGRVGRSAKKGWDACTGLGSPTAALAKVL